MLGFLITNTQYVDTTTYDITVKIHYSGTAPASVTLGGATPSSTTHTTEYYQYTWLNMSGGKKLLKYKNTKSHWTTDYIDLTLPGTYFLEKDINI